MFVCLLLCAKQFHVPFVPFLGFFFGLLVLLQHFVAAKNVRVCGKTWGSKKDNVNTKIIKIQKTSYGFKGKYKNWLQNISLYFSKNAFLNANMFDLKWRIFLNKKTFLFFLYPSVSSHSVCNSWTAFNAKNM